MILVTRREIEGRWERTTHDEGDNVQRANIFFWTDLGFLEENYGKLAFMHQAKLEVGSSGWFSRHHHGEKQDPSESNPQIGMLEVFVHISGRAAMYIDGDQVFFDVNTPVVIVQPGEVHSMINLLDKEFYYWVFGFSTGGGTWVVNN